MQDIASPATLDRAQDAPLTSQHCFSCGKDVAPEDSFALCGASDSDEIQIHARCALKMTMELLEMVQGFQVAEVQRREEAREPRVALSRRELQVLEGIVRGEKDREIAGRLGIAEHTVKNHAYDVRRKIGVRTRTEAAMQAVRTGLVRQPGPVRRSRAS